MIDEFFQEGHLLKNIFGTVRGATHCKIAEKVSESESQFEEEKEMSW